ncbi:DUF1192 domain-containing protein [Enterovirga rhinocerotis]|uniref:Uncharacterized small protein (DUF1192 family) n=1 Tax=Enterovirga rhinocerotis TaxID=1339210 RepID=A0A4R7BTF0_9HYPH|nr:DUF1192 domain-containing protein [Enterovirga rhinocerotis]TDR89000.1 uncharacterized small protein (DUF1192 family) [Enterovirga rhinocerotis]
MREDDDGLGTRLAVRHEIGCDLTAVSVDELDERVALLEAEIARLRAEKERKNASREAAAAFFR